MKLNIATINNIVGQLRSFQHLTNMPNIHMPNEIASCLEYGFIQVTENAKLKFEYKKEQTDASYEPW